MALVRPSQLPPLPLPPKHPPDHMLGYRGQEGEGRGRGGVIMTTSSGDMVCAPVYMLVVWNGSSRDGGR